MPAASGTICGEGSPGMPPGKPPGGIAGGKPGKPPDGVANGSQRTVSPKRSRVGCVPGGHVAGTDG